MLEAFSQQQWKRTLVLFVVCAAAGIAGAAIGISDNMPGFSLVLVSALAFVLAFVHPWRTTGRFLYLIGVSAVVLVAIVVGGGLIDNAGVNMGAFGDFLFYIAIFLCPMGLLVGIIGAVATWVASRRAHHLPPAKPVA